MPAVAGSGLHALPERRAQRKPRPIPALPAVFWFLRSSCVFALWVSTSRRERHRRHVWRGRARACEIVAATLDKWRCELIEFGGEFDHVHVLFRAHPALDVSSLVNNLKTVSSRRLRVEFAKELRTHYRKPVLWHGAYYVGTVGHASLETVKRYVERQGRDLWPAKRRAAEQKNR